MGLIICIIRNTWYFFIRFNDKLSERHPIARVLKKDYIPVTTTHGANY